MPDIPPDASQAVVSPKGKSVRRAPREGRALILLLEGQLHCHVGEEHYDLYSPDDLVYCGGDYDLETNRRIFFSSLCGELGMPTYGSSGYDSESALDIWFDSAPSGTLGSLHCFDGDENGDPPKPEWIAKYNGLSAIVRMQIHSQIQPVDAK